MARGRKRSRKSLAVIAVAGLSLSTAACSNDSAELPQGSELRALSRSFSVFRKQPSTMPPFLRRKTSATIARQFGHPPWRGEAWFADTPVGGIWLILSQDLACLISEPDGALACSSTSSMLRRGLSVGAFVPSNGTRPNGYWVKGIAPDRITGVRVRAGETNRLVRPVGSAFGVRSGEPVYIRGFKSPGENRRPSQGQLDS